MPCKSFWRIKLRLWKARKSKRLTSRQTPRQTTRQEVNLFVVLGECSPIRFLSLLWLLAWSFSKRSMCKLSIIFASTQRRGTMSSSMSNSLSPAALFKARYWNQTEALTSSFTIEHGVGVRSLTSSCEECRPNVLCRWDVALPGIGISRFKGLWWRLQKLQWKWNPAFACTCNQLHCSFMIRTCVCVCVCARAYLYVCLAELDFGTKIDARTPTEDKQKLAATSLAGGWSCIWYGCGLKTTLVSKSKSVSDPRDIGFDSQPYHPENCSWENSALCVPPQGSAGSSKKAPKVKVKDARLCPGKPHLPHLGSSACKLSAFSTALFYVEYCHNNRQNPHWCASGWRFYSREDAAIALRIFV